MREKISGLTQKDTTVVINEMKIIAGYKFDKQLSDFFGISRASFSEYRQNGRIPAKRIFQFCEEFNVEYTRFYTPEAGFVPEKVGDELDRLVDLLRKDHPEKLDKVIGFLHGILV